MLLFFQCDFTETGRRTEILHSGAHLMDHCVALIDWKGSHKLDVSYCNLDHTSRCLYITSSNIKTNNKIRFRLRVCVRATFISIHYFGFYFRVSLKSRLQHQATKEDVELICWYYQIFGGFFYTRTATCWNKYKRNKYFLCDELCDFFRSLVKIESKRIQLAWEWRDYTTKTKHCVNVSKHHFSMFFSLNQTHRERFVIVCHLFYALSSLSLCLCFHFFCQSFVS